MIIDAPETRAVAEARARRLTAPAIARGIRVHAGVTQESIARAVGVATPTVGNWELGRAKPSGDLLIKYADLLRRLLEASG